MEVNKYIYIDTLEKKKNNSIPWKWAELKRKDVLKLFLKRLEGKIEKISIEDKEITFKELLDLFNYSGNELVTDIPDLQIRTLFGIPENRYYTIANNSISIDKTRNREVKAQKISKSNQS